MDFPQLQPIVSPTQPPFGIIGFYSKLTKKCPATQLTWARIPLSKLWAIFLQRQAINERNVQTGSENFLKFVPFIWTSFDEKGRYGLANEIYRKRVGNYWRWIRYQTAAELGQNKKKPTRFVLCLSYSLFKMLVFVPILCLSVVCLFKPLNVSDSIARAYLGLHWIIILGVLSLKSLK